MGATQSWRVTLSLLGVIVLVFGFLTVGSFTQQSPTIDESVHLLGGYSYLQWGDYRVNPEHPPLVKMWAALPLLWFGVNDPRGSNPTWNQILKTEPGGPVYPLARETFFKLNDAATLFFYGKIQMLIVSIVLALFVYLWSRELFGASARPWHCPFMRLIPISWHTARLFTPIWPLQRWSSSALLFFGALQAV